MQTILENSAIDDIRRFSRARRRCRRRRRRRRRCHRLPVSNWLRAFHRCSPFRRFCVLNFQLGGRTLKQKYVYIKLHLLHRRTVNILSDFI